MGTTLISPERSRKAFVKRLSSLPLLKNVHFSDNDDARSDAVKRLNEEVFSLGHKLDDMQLKHFMRKGEIGRLLAACGSRFNDIVNNVKDAGIMSPSTAISIGTDWFVFDPSAYALTYELEDDAGFIVVLATPMLCGVYSADMKFSAVEDVAAFLDSILIHEIAHCTGSMKHDSEFKRTFNEICKLEHVVPII